MAKFLDLTGLQSVITKIKAWANNTFVPVSQKGVANGLATLDGTGKVPSAQLPSYVDDVINGYFNANKFYKEEAHTTEIAGEDGKIYVDLATNKTYRWSGTAFVEISASLALGETASTAFRGDLGKTAYDHSQADHARVDATKTEASATNGNIKVDGVEVEVYKHDTHTEHVSGLYKVTVDTEGHVSEAVPAEKEDITKLGIPGQDTTYGVMTGATASVAGKEGLAPAPTAGDVNRYLAADGTYKALPAEPTAITTAEIDALFAA